MNNTKDKYLEFKKELKTLLEKYDATIIFKVDSDSDTWGLSGECMVVKMDRKLYELCDGWGVESSDIS